MSDELGHKFRPLCGDIALHLRMSRSCRSRQVLAESAYANAAAFHADERKGKPVDFLGSYAHLQAPRLRAPNEDEYLRPAATLQDFVDICSAKSARMEQGSGMHHQAAHTDMTTWIPMS